MMISKKMRLMTYSLLVVGLIIYVIDTSIEPGELPTLCVLTTDQEVKKYPNEENKFREQDFKVDLTRRSAEDIAHEVQEALPSLPVTFCVQKRHEQLFYKNKSCAKFPDLYRLKHNNQYWQIFRTNNNDRLYLFGAYYDTRLSSPIGPFICILGMVEHTKIQEFRTYCQIWFANSSEPVIVQATEPFVLWRNPVDVRGFYYSVIFRCPIAQLESDRRIPMFVSLARSICEQPTNSLRVIYNKLDVGKKKDRFAVCVRIMDFYEEDQSVRIVEWIETLKLLGAKKIFFYPLVVHPNITKVLEYYKGGVVEITPITLAGFQPNFPGLTHLYIHDTKKNKFQNWENELISVNDCFYKNMYKYDYITSLDIDELIMPLKEDNWESLLNSVRNISLSQEKFKAGIDAYLFRPIHFRKNDGQSTYIPFSDIPSYMYMLQSVQRQTNYWASNFKSFFDTELVEGLYNHYPIKCFRGQCSKYIIDVKDAQLQHYHIRKNSKPLVNDTTIWRYKKTLIDRCLKVFYELGYFK